MSGLVAAHSGFVSHSMAVPQVHVPMVVACIEGSVLELPVSTMVEEVEPPLMELRVDGPLKTSLSSSESEVKILCLFLRNKGAAFKTLRFGIVLKGDASSYHSGGFN